LSAICGLIDGQLREAELRALLNAMLAALPLHPGSGSCHTLVESRVGLGVYQQFSSGTEAANQDRSVCASDGLLVACSAEIYNAGELKRKVGFDGKEYKGESSLIAALYHRYGEEVTTHLRGAFAFCIWSEQERSLLLATDPFAIRPIYYWQKEERFVFSSRVGAILRHPEVSRQVQPDAVYQYLYHNCIPTPNTIYKEIRKLPPGYLIKIDRSGFRLKPYWQLPFNEDHSKSVSYFAVNLRRYLTDAVFSQTHYKGDHGKIGTFLSGGTDSSTISGLVGQSLKSPARTFSIGFREDRFNEIEYAHLAARHFRTEHHEYFVTPEDTARLIPRLVAAYDEPFGNASAVPSYYCAQLARDHGVEIMMAGDGGDELFGGNSRYADDKVFEAYRKLPYGIRKHVVEPVLFNRLLPDIGFIAKGRKYVRRSNLSQPKRFFSYNLLYTIDPREIFSDEFVCALSGDPGLEAAEAHYQAVPQTSMLNRLLNIDLKITISDNDLRKVTTMCELAGVRVRYPMLDRALAEFSGQIPAWMKVRRLNKRFIFKEALKDFLPHEIIVKKKHGFGLPISSWILETPALRELARDTLLSRVALQRGYFNRKFLERLFDLHQEDRTTFFGDNIWVFLMLELWHQVHLRS
jgi:asparagine synthase (glutamine-hydrolysing)